MGVVAGLLIAWYLTSPYFELQYKYKGSETLRDKDRMNHYDFTRNVRKKYVSIGRTLMNKDYLNYPFTEGDPRNSDKLNLKIIPTSSDEKNNTKIITVYKSSNSRIFFIFVNDESGKKNWYGPFLEER